MSDLFKLDPGWHYDVPMETYLADEALSSSGLQDFKRSAHYYRFRQNSERVASKAMTNGTAFHTAVLEPDEFDRLYVIAGQCVARKKSGERCTNPGTRIYRDKAFCGVRGHHPKPDFIEEEGGPEIVEKADRDAMGIARDNLHKHKHIMQYFKGVGASEVTGIWVDEPSGVRCKIRLDRELERVSHHVDLKYTASADVRAFKRQTWSMGWMHRSAFYRRGMKALGRAAPASIIIASESEPAHDCNLFILDEAQIGVIGQGIDQYLTEFAACQQSGDWPGDDEAPGHLTLEDWQL